MAKLDLASLPYCPDCGATRLSGAKFCPHCGCSFTGVARAKGALPSIAPATRPMMPAVALAGLSVKSGAAAVDIEALEGIKPFLTGNVVPLRPRSSLCADVDDPDVLASKGAPAQDKTTQGAHAGRLVERDAARLSDACSPDEPECMGPATVTDASQLTTPQRHARPTQTVAPMRLHLVTHAMARVDDPGSLGPPPGPLAPPRRNTRVASIPVESLGSIESLERPGGARLTSQAGLVDEAVALASRGQQGFVLGLGVTHQGAVLANATLIDDPTVLAGGLPAHSPLTRAIANGAETGSGRVDEADAIAPGPPRQERAREPVLHEAWADAAEKMISRKDDRANVAAVPVARELLLAPDRLVLAPAPVPEPEVPYVPAPPVPTAPTAPWAAFALPMTPAPIAESHRPGAATMMMSLDAVELRMLAERLAQKGVLSSDDLDAAKKK